MAWWKSLRSDWRKLRALPAEERRLIGLALLVLPLCALGIRLFGCRRCLRVLGYSWRAGGVGPPRGPRGANAPRSPEDAAARIATTLRLLDAAARRAPVPASCLPRSLTLWWLLRRQGIDSNLRIGVRKEAGRFEAHAWLEANGQVLNDRADVALRYRPFRGLVFSPNGAEYDSPGQRPGSRECHTIPPKPQRGGITSVP